MGPLTEPASILLDRTADEAFAGLDAAFLRGATVLVTGATGLVGGTFVRALLRASGKRGLGLRLVLPMRRSSRAAALFPDPCVHAVEWPGLLAPLEAPPADFAVHAAAMTSSLDMVRRPAETLLATFEGTRSFLEWARAGAVRKAVLLSSLEAYGIPPPERPDMDEASSGRLDPMNPRSSYPEGKRAAEALCAAYAAQHGLPVCVARLAQTFGPGAEPGDRRAFAQFARVALAGAPITLHTAGTTSRNYCHVADAAGALLALLRDGVAGEAYNVAHDGSYVSVRELAARFASAAGAGSRIEFDHAGEAAFGYAPELHVRLRTEKLAALGFRARFDLGQAVSDLLDWYRLTLPPN